MCEIVLYVSILVYFNFMATSEELVSPSIMDVIKGVLQSKKWISQNYTRCVMYVYTRYS